MINVIYNEKGRDKLYKTWHTPDSNMIIYIKRGDGSIVFSDSVYEMCEGVLCFIASKCHHYTMPDAPEDYVRSKVFFSDGVLLGLCDFCADTFLKESSVIYAKIPKEQRQEVEALFEGLQKTEDKLTQRSVLLRLAVFLKKYTKLLQEQPKGFIATTVSYINTHIQDDISIEILSKNAHLSKYHFCRRFKSMTGQTVMEYILKTRLTRALDLIRDTDLPIGEISDACGFSSISYFCRVFKEWSGTSPLKYRKNK